MAEYHLSIPLCEEDVEQLQVGDTVYFSGEAWTGRCRLHERVFVEGHAIPFSTQARNLLIHVGPIVVQDGGGWKLMAFSPTSSIQVDAWGPLSVERWGLRAIVGKTTMGAPTMAAMARLHCIHATPIGVMPALFVEHIRIKNVHWLDELGSMEAAWVLELYDLGPFLVDIDCQGRNHFDQLAAAVDDNRKRAYRRLGVPEGFEHARLY